MFFPLAAHYARPCGRVQTSARINFGGCKMFAAVAK
jgi:hypothetical protein